MEALGALTREQGAQAREEQLAFQPSRSPFLAPHFVDMVLAASRNARNGDTQLNAKSLKIHASRERIETTLDSQLQAEVAGIIESHRPALQRHGAANVSVVVLDNATGEWLAWEGSGDYFDAARGGTINGPLVPRQPGSALKPFTYALAFEEGLGPATVLADIPSSFPTAEPGIVYSPRNYDGRYRGPMLARAALAGSENVPAVALASELGIPRLLRFLGRAGLSTLEKTAAHYGLGLTLGNAEVRLDELVAAYAALARGGEWLRPTWEPGTRDQASRRVVSQRTAFWITDILADDQAREYVFGRGGSLEFPFPVAVKTGTSQAYHDNWTVGYSKHVTVGVWVGNFDRTPLRNSSGVTGAAPIFQGVMLAAERRGGLERPTPDHILFPGADSVRREICALSGRPANSWCPNRRHEWVAAESPALPCAWHHLSDGGLLTMLPPEYAAWARGGAAEEAGGATAQSVGTGAEVPVTHAQAARASLRVRTDTGLAIVSPAEGATYLIDPTLRPEFQRLSLKAVAAYGATEWKVNGRVVGTTRAGAGLAWTLTRGRHRITVRDERGRVAEASITVR
jgi:penicillin-binding protein 1C